ncbi:MAG: nitrous oxide reductase family maturation protein NosD [Chitinophagaceae bacterium]|nr:nitrous oxide reductase family maturation protein NosD [Chitinophagaceae bacterium]
MKILIVYITLLLSGLFYAGIVSAKNIYVGKQRAYKTIKAGLQAAVRGDTVFVDKGIYQESGLEIDKSIYVKGNGYPVIDGQKKGTVITIHADGAVLDGFKIINSGNSEQTDYAGVLIVDSYNVIVKNNQLVDNQFSIYSQHSRNCRILDNVIHSNAQDEVLSGNGIHCWRSDSLLIIGNNISGQRDGIYFEFVTNSLVWRNISHNNLRYGIHFMFSHHDTYISNVFEKNGSGVAVMFTHHVQMYNNFFLDNWGGAAYGILLKEITDSYISGNHFSHNTTAIEMEGCNRTKFFKNSFIDNGYAMRVSASSMDNEVYENNFIKNTFDVATNGTLVLNKFYRNYWDKYDGYDLNRDGIGDIPYRPVSLYSTIVESNPSALMLFRSIIVSLLDKTEKLIPGITPENLKDDQPCIKPIKL